MALKITAKGWKLILMKYKKPNNIPGLHELQKLMVLKKKTNNIYINFFLEK